MENTKTKTMETTKRFDNSPIELDKRKYKMYLNLEREKFKMLYNQTYDETFKSVHSGKNKYRLPNKVKEHFKEISKMLDVVKSMGITIDEVLELVSEGFVNTYNRDYK
jgi:DNA-binding transcriptional regulator YhcF (GntR family)